MHCLRLGLSVSYGGCKTVRETVRSFFADVPVVTLRRKAYPKLETLVAVTENIPGLTDGQTLPFEEYGILLRNCPAVTLMPDADLDALRRLEGRYGNILPCGCIRRPGGAGSCQSGRDAGCAGIVLGAVSGNPRHVAIADLSRCDSGAGACCTAPETRMTACRWPMQSRIGTTFLRKSKAVWTSHFRVRV